MNMVAMYENAKTRPVETLPGWEVEVKDNGGGGVFDYDIL
jgi:hypothetical protein